MEDDKFDELFDETTAQFSNDETEVETAETEEETEAQAEVETEVEVQKEEAEKPSEEGVEAEAETVPKETVIEEKAETSVPLKALLEEREKAKANKTQADALQKQLDNLQKARSNSEIPDPYLDKQGYSEFVQKQIAAQVQQQMMGQKLLSAREKAVAEHGEEFVTTLADWADDYAAKIDPMVSDKALASPDPVAFLIDLKKRQETYSAFETNEEDFIRQRAIEMGLIPTVEQSAVATQTTTPKRPQGSKSIANSPSVASAKTKDSGDAFDAIFK